MSDQSPAPGASTEPPAPGPGAAEECESCIGARGVLLALGFAAFAAYVAADFATGGKLTAAVLGALAVARGRVPPSSTTAGDDDHR